MYNINVMVNLPGFKEIAFQLKAVDMNAIIPAVEAKYPEWTSLNLVVVRTEDAVQRG